MRQHGDDLTPAADVYALGLVLLESLTGEPALTIGEEVQTALRRLAAPPEIPASIDADWRGILAWMTHSSPAGRPTASDVVEAMTRVLADRPPQAPTAPPPGAGTGRGAASGPVPKHGPLRAQPPVPESRRPAARRRPLRSAVLAGVGAVILASTAGAGVWASAQTAPGDARVASSHAAGSPPVVAPTVAPPTQASTPVVPAAPAAVSIGTRVDEAPAQGPDTKAHGPKPGKGHEGGRGDSGHSRQDSQD